MNKILLCLLISKLVFLPIRNLNSGGEKKEKPVIATLVTSDGWRKYSEATIPDLTKEKDCPYFEIKESWPVYQLIDIEEIKPRSRNLFGEIIFSGQATFLKKIKVYGLCQENLSQSFQQLLSKEKEEYLERIIVRHSSYGTYLCLRKEPDEASIKLRKTYEQKCYFKSAEECLDLEAKLIKSNYRNYLCRSLK